MPDADWRPAVRQAVLAAEARKPMAVFDVVTPVPVKASRAEQDRVIRQGQDDAALVARELQFNSIPPARIRLSLRGDPGTPPRQVQIIVE